MASLVTHEKQRSLHLNRGLVTPEHSSHCTSVPFRRVQLLHFAQEVTEAPESDSEEVECKNGPTCNPRFRIGKCERVGKCKVQFPTAASPCINSTRLQLLRFGVNKIKVDCPASVRPGWPSAALRTVTWAFSSFLCHVVLSLCHTRFSLTTHRLSLSLCVS